MSGLTTKAEPPPTRDVNREAEPQAPTAVGSGDLSGRGLIFIAILCCQLWIKLPNLIFRPLITGWLCWTRTYDRQLLAATHFLENPTFDILKALIVGGFSIVIHVCQRFRICECLLESLTPHRNQCVPKIHE